ncbi:galactosylceramide sulfotransferase [Galendromus occidentalis]|uniref:Galactosylceramide sulfotransferase n=1 Tax=Galendromus occidentalis TaxID=34638 RepID=A0AAJ6QPT4_9ACAR|nr:galactosylceramide sulfotransferase [Galendromus occidentalis]
MNTSDSASYACKKREHIYFMKTHKCASSSVQNVFFRYGDKHNLTFVLPPGGTNYFGHPKYFNRAMLPTTVRPVTYSIFALHTRFQRTEVRKVMPSDTVYITILRDPVALFASMFSYYDMKRMYRLSLVNLVREHPEPLDPIYRERKFSKFGLNQMAFDLGLPPSQFRNADIVDRFIKRLEETFDLVLIAERMPESLVLLRYLLCWDVDDVILFKKNARSTSYKKIEQQLTSQDADTLKRLNEADQRIYDHFNKVLSEKLELFGLDRVAEEKALIDERTKFWYNECVDTVRNVDQETAKKKKIYSNQVMYFEERKGADPECQRFLREELAYAAYLRERQRNLYFNASSSTRH